MTLNVFKIGGSIINHSDSLEHFFTFLFAVAQNPKY